MSSIRDFVPLSKLGEGTFIRRLSDHKIYALKKVKLNNLTSKQKQNALNEIRILASFECPYIVAYKEAFFDDKLHVLCIVMQFADGGDLHKFINDTKKDFRKVNEICIWNFAADIITALDHLHQKGILHRDLKSANIFIHGQDYKLGDLNVSKVNGGKLAYTQTGTPYYASPEVWRDEPYDHKSDIWSFGCILYELACLKPPFQGKDMDELYQNVQKSAYSAIPQEYSLELAQLIDRCMKKNPKARPSAAELLKHPVISRFRTRKNAAFDQTQAQKQLLQTIKLPSDLRALKMNLPSSKYDDANLESKENEALNNQKYDIKNYVSDRPRYLNSNKNNAISPNAQVYRNQSLLVGVKEAIHIQSPRGINHSEVYMSPKNRKQKQYESLHRSPEDLIGRKIASAHVNYSQKKASSPGYTERRVGKVEQNYSDRRASSQKKSAILDRYDKFIHQELEKKPVAMPRTEKRIISSQGRYQPPNPTTSITEPVSGPDKKDIEEWKRKLVKKSRVFSNNILGNKPGCRNHELR